MNQAHYSQSNTKQSFARPTPAPNSNPSPDIPPKALWDPWEALDIYPKSQAFTCVGIGKKTGGKRCGWHVFWERSCAPAEAALELMSTMQPSQITRDRLITLAEHCLCVHNHQYQAPDVAADWSVRIARYVKGAHGQLDLANGLRDVKAELERAQKQSSSSDELASLRGKLAESTAMVQALRESQMAKMNESTGLNERLTVSMTRLAIIEDTNKVQTQMIEDLKQRCAVECERTRVGNELYDRCKKNNSRLRSENDTKEETVKGLKRDIDSLERELAESRKVEGSQGREIDDLREKLMASDERIKAEKDTNEEKAKGLKKDIERLETELTESRKAQRTKERETDDLRQQLVASDERMKTDNDTNGENVKSLKEDIESLQTELAESEKAQRTKERETNNLRQQLTASDERIKELQVTKDETIRLRQRIEEVNEALGEKYRHISQLQQDHQRLKIQTRFRAFANHVILSAKQKKYERVVHENSTLSEQGQILNRRLEQADQQLVAQDRMFSKFKLKDVRKGICAVFAVKPLRVSLRRFSKIGEAAG